MYNEGTTECSVDYSGNITARVPAHFHTRRRYKFDITTAESFCMQTYARTQFSECTCYHQRLILRSRVEQQRSRKRNLRSNYFWFLRLPYGRMYREFTYKMKPWTETQFRGRRLSSYFIRTSYFVVRGRETWLLFCEPLLRAECG